MEYAKIEPTSIEEHRPQIGTIAITTAIFPIDQTILSIYAENMAQLLDKIFEAQFRLREQQATLPRSLRSNESFFAIRFILWPLIAQAINDESSWDSIPQYLIIRNADSKWRFLSQLQVDNGALEMIDINDKKWPIIPIGFLLLGAKRAENLFPSNRDFREGINFIFRNTSLAKLTEFLRKEKFYQPEARDFFKMKLFPASLNYFWIKTLFNLHMQSNEDSEQYSHMFRSNEQQIEADDWEVVLNIKQVSQITAGDLLSSSKARDQSSDRLGETATKRTISDWGKQWIKDNILETFFPDPSSLDPAILITLRLSRNQLMQSTSNFKKLCSELRNFLELEIIQNEEFCIQNSHTLATELAYKARIHGLEPPVSISNYLMSRPHHHGRLIAIINEHYTDTRRGGGDTGVTKIFFGNRYQFLVTVTKILVTVTKIFKRNIQRIRLPKLVTVTKIGNGYQKYFCPGIQILSNATGVFYHFFAERMHLTNSLRKV